MQEIALNYILFEKMYGNRPLFDNQTALACALIAAPDSPYFVEKTSSLYYYKFNNLRNYISRLLANGNKKVTRVTDDFVETFKIILFDRLANTEYNSEEIYNEIITEIKRRNPKKYRTPKPPPLQPNSEWKAFNDKIEDWIDKFVPASEENAYNRGLKAGIRQGSMLMWGLMQDMLKGQAPEKDFSFQNNNFTNEIKTNTNELH